MDEPGSELHPTGTAAPEAPICEISLTEDESEGNDCSRCEDLTYGSSDPDAPISGTRINDDFQGVNCPRYEDVIYEEKLEPPPPYMPPPPFTSAPVQITIPTSIISEDIARRALLEYAKKKFCYSAGPAQHMLLRDFQPLNTFRYRLDTFIETRTCKWMTDPYHGEEVDGPSNGPAPEPWTLQAEPPNLFQKADYCVPVPHTSSVEICVDCGGLGRNICLSCLGVGRRLCISCGGSGWGVNQRCFGCGGSGRSFCFMCSGTGRQICTTCCSTGRVIKYILLTVTWENHNFEFISDHKSDFTTKRFKKVTGEILFSDERQSVPPVNHFPEPSVSEASTNAISRHLAAFTNSKIVRQRHSIEWLPLTKVTYTWSGGDYDYYVYGKENRAYAENYPRKCCCAVV